MIPGALVRGLDGTGSEQRGEDQPQDVEFPTVTDAAEASFERFAGASVLVAVLLFADEIVIDFLADIGAGVRYKLWTFFDDKPEAIVTSVENFRQRFEIDRLEQEFGVALFDGASTHLQLRVQIGDGLAQHLLDDLAEALAEIGTIP